MMENMGKDARRIEAPEITGAMLEVLVASRRAIIVWDADATKLIEAPTPADGEDPDKILVLDHPTAVGFLEATEDGDPEEAAANATAYFRTLVMEDLL